MVQECRQHMSNEQAPQNHVGDEGLYEYYLGDPEHVAYARDPEHLTYLAKASAAKERFGRAADAGLVIDESDLRWRRLQDANYELHLYEYNYHYRDDPPPFEE